MTALEIVTLVIATVGAGTGIAALRQGSNRDAEARNAQAKAEAANDEVAFYRASNIEHSIEVTTAEAHTTLVDLSVANRSPDCTFYMLRTTLEQVDPVTKARHQVHDYWLEVLPPMETEILKAGFPYAVDRSNLELTVSFNDVEGNDFISLPSGTLKRVEK